VHENGGSGKILVIRGGAIGDFILTLPAIAALRRQFPNAHLEVLGYPHIVQLAVAGKLVDRVQYIEARPLAGFFARNGTLEPDLVDYFSEFDLIVSYLFDPDDIFKTNVARCSTAQFVVGPHRPRETENLHATEVFLKPLERLAIFEADRIPRLSILDDPADAGMGKAVEGARSVRPRIAFHPGSGSEKKNWPAVKWAELLQQLVARSAFDLLLVGGDAEATKIEALTQVLPGDRCRVAQSLPLRELAARLGECVGYVGHDSGITHLAAAMGLPALVLWADTAEHVWRPLGNNVVVLRSERGLASLAVERVLSQVLQLESTRRFDQDRSSQLHWR
jgi:heptosyltransferase-2